MAETLRRRQGHLSTEQTMTAYEIPVHEYLKTLLSKKKLIRLRCEKKRENEDAEKGGPLLTKNQKRKCVVYVKSERKTYTVCGTNERIEHQYRHREETGKRCQRV